MYNYGTGTQQQYSGNGTVNTRIGERFRVTLKAEDSDGGVSRIEWSRSDGWTCSNGTIGQNSGPSLGAVTGQSLSPNAQNQVVTSVVLIQDVDLNFTCQPGLSFKSGSTVLQGTGKNHHSGATAGQLVFNVGP